MSQEIIYQEQRIPSKKTFGRVIKEIRIKSKGGSACRATLDENDNVRIFLAGDYTEGTHTLTSEDVAALKVKFKKAPFLDIPKLTQPKKPARAGYGGGHC